MQYFESLSIENLPIEGGILGTYFQPRCAMGKTMESGSSRAASEETRIEGATTSDGLLVSSPASVVGPHTPEAAGNRRMRQKLLISDAESCGEDCDDEVMGFVSYNDSDIGDTMEEPVAITRVRAFALARCFTGRESKVTLERARAKLDYVKATGEKRLKKRNLEDFIGGHVDVGVDFFVSSEFDEGQPKVVKSRGFSVEKARAKLETVMTKKELDKPKVKKPLKKRKASKADANEEEVWQEGIWVRQAKVKLEAAREKRTKFSRRRTLQAIGIKKGDVQHEISSNILIVDRGDDVDGVISADGAKVSPDFVVDKETSARGKTRKGSKQKAVRASERIANSRLRMQQGVVLLEEKGERGRKKAKVRRSKANKSVESKTEICVGLLSELSRPREETEGAPLDRDVELSPAMSLELTSSVELTSRVRTSRKIQQKLFDSIPPPGSRLSSGVQCVPPVSPYGLIQEHLYEDPWKVLVACMLLNKTGGRQMHKVIWDLFELCPDAETCVSTEAEKIGSCIHSLGLQNKRAKTLQRFSQDYLGTMWTNVTELHGIGEYARDAHAIFCEGRWEEVQPKDVVLNKYWRWLSDTQGLGYGYSQIE